MANNYIYETGSALPREKSLWDYFVETYTKNYANHRGRARRREFWGFVLFFSLIYIGLSILGILIFGFNVSAVALAQSSDVTNPFANLLSVMTGLFLAMSLPLIFLLVSFVPVVCLCVRRLHDRGLSGWLYFLPYGCMLIANIMFFVEPIIGSIFFVMSCLAGLYLLIQYMLGGQPGVNKYGSNPKETNTPNGNYF